MSSATLGLDIGGTKIASGLVGLDGTVAEADATPTLGSGRQVVDQVAEIIDTYRTRHPIDTVGLAVPGGVDPRTGIITAAPNLAWLGLDLADRLHTHLPSSIFVHVDNDAGAAAWAEHRFGRHRDGDSLLLVTVGTGLGGGVVANGALVRGFTGAGGEIGHLPLLPGGRTCECGSHGCWEQYASGQALHRAAQAAGWDTATAGYDILRAAHQGDSEAADVVAGVAAHLVHGIMILTAILDPARVLLGGGLGTDPLFHFFVQEAAAQAELTPPRARVPLHPASLGVMAGVIGAADLARHATCGIATRA
ncbi:ROK family glucokinase [Acrocarpospora macrocephala]|uniref:Glucokinase n=1 Tax=Acrocarpospora macrocephala TaxID=150177 RepID=A0A5M3WHB1_9ACTN|nr:ROK family protein [Acrocarpospora macrocephala]GES06493.1 glucokinase [Acrocarpospora macrocephala]